MDRKYLAGAAVGAALALSGCVTQGTYEKLEAEKARLKGELLAAADAHAAAPSTSADAQSIPVRVRMSWPPSV